MKYKGVEVRKKPWWTRIYMPRAHAFTMLDKIYLNEKRYAEVKSGKMSADTEAMMAHEVTHIKRFRKYGVIKSEITYWLSKDFRYQEELAAIKEDMKVLKKHKEKYKFKEAIKHLSGFSYLWCVSKEQVTNDLKELWKKA